MRLNPHFEDPDYFWVLGMAYFTMENLEKAATSFEKAHRLKPEERWYTLPLAVTYAHLGLDQQAHDTIIWSTGWLNRPAVAATVMVYLPFKDLSAYFLCVP